MSGLISKAKACNYIKACVNPYGKPFGGTTYEFGLKIMEYIENSECDKTLEEHDKEIRNKAIEEFAEEIKSTLPIAVHRDCSEVDYEVDYALYSLRHRIDRIAEQLKGEAI